VAVKKKRPEVDRQIGRAARAWVRIIYRGTAPSSLANAPAEFGAPAPRLLLQHARFRDSSINRDPDNDTDAD